MTSASWNNISPMFQNRQRNTNRRWRNFARCSGVGEGDDHSIGEADGDAIVNIKIKILKFKY